MDPTIMLAAALRYAAVGWPVFPVAPGAKVPLHRSPHPYGSPERATCRGECGLMGHGVYDATEDPDLVCRWWTRRPAANIGLACGKPGPDVVDIDTKNGAPGMASLARLREAGLLRGALAVVTTPSGGLHIYFAGTGQHNSTRARHGVDFRSAGGYVLAPPSTVDGRPYVLGDRRPVDLGQPVDWAAIVALLDPPRPARVNVGTSRQGSPAGDVAGLVRWLENRPSGDRNAALLWACHRALDAGATDRDLEQLRDAIVRAGHDLRDATKTVQSARRRAGVAT